MPSATSRARVTSRRCRESSIDLQRVDTDISARQIPEHGVWTMKLTYYGHSCFSVELNGRSLLFDPFITPNELARAIDINKVPADYILISHGHSDHTADALALAKRTGATLIANFEVATWFNQKGVQVTHPMNHGGAYQFDFGRVKYVNAIHSSSMPDGSYGGNPGGFVIESGAGNFYFSGDTALTLDMKLIGESTRLKFAVLCIGDNFTMGAEDAVKAAEFVGCNDVVGVHYDTFPPIRIDHQRAKDTFKAGGKILHLFQPGESHEFKT
jgi:L-ascorbate metabolism protein UlaG (beta-lactamase superfamily)